MPTIAFCLVVGLRVRVFVLVTVVIGRDPVPSTPFSAVFHHPTLGLLSVHLLGCIITTRGVQAGSLDQGCHLNLEFLETWKCQGIRLRSGKGLGKCPTSGKSRGKGREVCVVGEI